MRAYLSPPPPASRLHLQRYSPAHFCHQTVGLISFETITVSLNNIGMCLCCLHNGMTDSTSCQCKMPRRRRESVGDSPIVAAGGRDGATQRCPHCRKYFKRRGFGHHEARCREEMENSQRDLEALAAIEKQERSRKRSMY